MYQILIVEDDRGLNQGIALALRQEGLSFLQAYTKGQGLDLWRTEAVDMALLDVNLPDGSGYELLKEIRKHSQIPILLITANDLEYDELTGFSLGADDYIVKPFSLMALRARVERIRIRTGEGKQKKSGEYQDSRYRFRFDVMQFFVDGQEIELSRTEQRLLGMFVRHPGQTLSREQLTDILWPGGADYVEENALSVAVGRLRRKLVGKSGYHPIETVYGIGYVWDKQV